MKIRTQLKAGRINMRGENHNETLQVQSGVKAGARVRGLAVRSQLKAGGKSLNHNDTLQTRTGLKAGRINLRAAVQTTARKGDRLELLVVRAGLKAGRRGFRRMR
jgi:hypothetical protein